MVSVLDKTIDRIRAEREAAEKQNPPPDTEAIFAAAQKNAATARSANPPHLTPEAASTPAVVISTQSVQPRTDLIRLMQPVSIKGH